MANNPIGAFSLLLWEKGSEGGFGGCPLELVSEEEVCWTLFFRFRPLLFELGLK
jgi:hypothetical protein